MFLRIHVPDSSAEHCGDPSIERLKDEVCVMSFLTQIYPVKRGDPGIQSRKRSRQSRPRPAQELSLGIQQTRHETRELCVSRCRSHAEVFIDDQLIRIAVRHGIFRFT